MSSTTSGQVDNYYEFLGIANFASRHEVAAAVERAAREATAVEHTNPQRSLEIRDRLRLIREELLSDEAHKRDYDAWLATGAGTPSSVRVGADSVCGVPLAGPANSAESGQTEQLWPVPTVGEAAWPRMERSRAGLVAVVAGLVVMAAVAGGFGITLLVTGWPSADHGTMTPTPRTVPTVPPDLRTATILQGAVTNFQTYKGLAFGPKHLTGDLPNYMSGEALKGIRTQTAILISRHEHETLGWASAAWSTPVFAPDATATISVHAKLHNETTKDGSTAGIPTPFWIWATYRLTYGNGHWLVSYYWLSQDKMFWQVGCGQRSDARSDAKGKDNTC